MSSGRAARRLLGCCLLLLSVPREADAKLRRFCKDVKENDELIIDCGGDIINSVDFASYGTPVGHCPKEATESNPFTRGKCDSKRSISTLEEKCLAGSTCLLLVNSEMFGGDPCPAVAVKRLVAQVTCGEEDSPGADPGPPPNPMYGWKFIALVFFLFAFYLGLGIWHNVRRSGAMGVEAIPHLEMWKDLPYLVRDGVVFSIDTIKSKARSQYQTVL